MTGLVGLLALVGLSIFIGAGATYWFTELREEEARPRDLVHCDPDGHPCFQLGQRVKRPDVSGSCGRARLGIWQENRTAYGSAVEIACVPGAE